MALDYEAIRKDKEAQYGWDVARLGRLIAEDIYADRMHFIFELLQNAEDALRQRADGAGGPKSVSFVLSDGGLRFSHHGKPFDEKDVRGICEIGKSTKDFTSIGRFGVGFKAVYAVTDRPEIHSGPEDFAIEEYVKPTAVSPIDRALDETVILLPFKSNKGSDHREVTNALDDLGPSTILFLSEIEEIGWENDGQPRSSITRKTEVLSPGVRRVRISGNSIATGEWLLFSREVSVVRQESSAINRVEIAFKLGDDGSVEAVNRSPLSVFFPTSVETGFRFLIHGPYTTTLARDNVPWPQEWNKRLVSETAALLKASVRWMRDNDCLNARTLSCLPIEVGQYRTGSITRPEYAPIYEATKQMLSWERLLPGVDGYAPAKQARLAGVQEIRDLLTGAQLADIYAESGAPSWLGGTITQNQTPELWAYLVSALDVPVVTPESMIPRLRNCKDFLEQQSDEFIVRLYAFYDTRRHLLRDLSSVPLVRLENGSHVAPLVNGQPQAFLQADSDTGFPTVKAEICKDETAYRFLRDGLGLREPDLVDDVIENILPRYQGDAVEVSVEDYAIHIQRISRAFSTDSRTQRRKLVDRLRFARFVRAVDAGSGSRLLECPDQQEEGKLYFPTDGLKALFDGVAGVHFVDAEYTCLVDGNAEDLLRSCGVSFQLAEIWYGDTELTDHEKNELRKSTGNESNSRPWDDTIYDKTLHGLDHLLSALPKMEKESKTQKAMLLWEALCDLEGQAGRKAFTGTYEWFYQRERTANFPAAFVRQLKRTAWVPGEDGELARPDLVLFDRLGWRSHPFLEAEIGFKRPIIDTLAQEAGLEPGAIDLMRQEGLTEAELRELIELRNQARRAQGKSDDNGVGRAADESSVPRTSENRGPVANTGNRDTADSRMGSGGGARSSAGASSGTSNGRDAGSGQGNRRSADSGSWVYHPNVAVEPDQSVSIGSPNHDARMEVEEQAIRFILEREPVWQPMPSGNPGYDLRRDSPNGGMIYCEVKGMSGTLADHPAEMTPTEFESARGHGAAYWLYVVENVGQDTIRMLKIQDPAGRAHRFSFDTGWERVAEIVS